ncbi:hypothetical protein BV25DRAFT_1840104 [Artomyces pyxidatus]|uniref:Uncharacterized protein n=1 Tax=Artomyces pyxidatus TaxID=48021 RepID=A0ACB8SVD5_9AGAM|nr:hypothetical protein BV25DRAFT_1840104 [Artomyces pyxidatus]
MHEDRERIKDCSKRHGNTLAKSFRLRKQSPRRDARIALRPAAQYYNASFSKTTTPSREVARKTRCSVAMGKRGQSGLENLCEKWVQPEDIKPRHLVSTERRVDRLSLGRKSGKLSGRGRTVQAVLAIQKFRSSACVERVSLEVDIEYLGDETSRTDSCKFKKVVHLASKIPQPPNLFFKRTGTYKFTL